MEGCLLFLCPTIFYIEKEARSLSLPTNLRGPEDLCTFLRPVNVIDRTIEDLRGCREAAL